MEKKEERDPIADYIEWTNHRYTPGYYLGGRVPPHIKNLGSLGRKGRRTAGLLFLVGGVWAVIEVIRSSADTSTKIGTGIFPALIVVVGIVMLLAKDTNTDAKTPRKSTRHGARRS